MGHLSKFTPECQEAGKPLVQAALQLHKAVMRTFRKTATNFHYEFNVRHMAGVFQGMLMGQAGQVPEPLKLAQLWLHESERVYGDRLVSSEDLEKYRVLALAQSALYSGARCTLFPSPCCAPRGERVPFFGRDGGRGRRPRSRRGFECHVCAHRSTLPFDDKARDGLRSPTRKSRHEVGSSITRVRVVQRGSVAGCRVGGSDGGGAVRGDGTIDVGARVDGGEVRELERLSKHHSIIDEHAGSGGRVVVLKGAPCRRGTPSRRARHRGRTGRWS
jgi:hypothetical protein